jgi:hypothetical protein
MYNKTIIGFGCRMISRIIQTSVYVIRLSFASADNIALGLNNSWYHAQPHPIIAYYLQCVILSPSRQREAPCEGTNSLRLFTPVETKALAKSKVHQWSWALTNGVEWVAITDLKIWLFDRSEEGKKYKKIHVRKLGKSFHITNCTTFLQFLNVNIDKNWYCMINPKV